jgi:Ca2+-binding RTX toxin-like protein
MTVTSDIFTPNATVPAALPSAPTSSVTQNPTDTASLINALSASPTASATPIAQEDGSALLQSFLNGTTPVATTLPTTTPAATTPPVAAPAPLVASTTTNTFLSGTATTSDVFQVDKGAKLAIISGFNPTNDVLNLATTSGQIIMEDTAAGVAIIDSKTATDVAVDPTKYANLEGALLLNVKAADLKGSPALKTSMTEVDINTALATASVPTTTTPVTAATQDLSMLATPLAATATTPVVSTVTTPTAPQTTSTSVPLPVNDASVITSIAKAMGVDTTTPSSTAPTTITPAPTMNGTAGRDIMYGDAGDNVMDGKEGGDALLGFEGNDTLNGSDDGDVLMGGIGNNIINGGKGRDLVIVQNGNNTITGGADSNIIAITADAKGSNTITDFKKATDKLVMVGNRIFTTVDSMVGTTLTFQDGGTLTINGVTAADVNANIISINQTA